MASANSVPRVHRRYHFDHAPPPSESVELMENLRRGLRGVPKGGFWSRVKSVGWRLLLKFDSRDEQPLRPDFPLAPPSTPVPRTRKISPDIHIHPAGRPDFLLSPPPPQEDGFLFVPVRSSRSSRSRHRERLPPSPRPLPTPPGPPSCAIPEITCCPWANSPSTPSPSTSSSTSSSSSANSDIDAEELDQIRFFSEIAPYLFLPDKEDTFDDDDEEDESQALDTSGSSKVAVSSSMTPPPGLQDDAMTMSSTQTQEIQDAAADRSFLEDLGLTPQAFMALLDGTGIEWDDDEADQD